MSYYIYLLLAIIFLAIPLFAAYYFKTDMHRPILLAMSKMLLRLGVLSIVTYYLITWNSVTLTIIFILLLLFYTIVTVVVRARLKLHTYIIPISIGIIASVLLVSVCLLVLCLTDDRHLDVRYVLPVFAIISGSIVDTLSKSLNIYYSGLHNHHQLYYYLLYNGASSHEALQYMMRKAMKKAFIPNVSKMASMAVGISPIIMWSMIMCGEKVLDAFFFQVIIVLATMSASVTSVAVALFVARHYIVDDYGKIANTQSDDVIRLS